MPHDCTEVNRLERIEAEQARQTLSLREKLSAIDERTRETNVDIRLMAQSVSSLAISVEKLGEMKEQFHDLDKRLSNSEDTIRYIKIIGVAITMALVGIAVASIYGG